MRPHPARESAGNPGRRGAEALGDLLERFLEKSGAGRALAREEIDRRWRLAAGESLGAAVGETRVLGLREGALSVAVSSSALLSEISTFHRETLLAALRRTGPPFAEVRELTLKLGAFDTP